MTRGRSSLEGDTLGTTRGIVGGPHCIPAGAPSISDRQKKAILLQSAEEIRKAFLRADAEKVAHTKIRVEDWVRDTPRHFAACRNDGSLIVLASDLALLPAKTFAAIIAHEFGHATDFAYPGSFLLSNRGDLVVRPQGRRSNQSVPREVLERWEKRSSDDVETTADRIAERIMGIQIGYCGPCNLQTMLTGAPEDASCHPTRPRGLRLDIMSYKTKPGYTCDNQAQLSAIVPDTDEGSIGYCVAELSSWQLEKTSVAALDADHIPTKSGVGRWVRMATASSPLSANRAVASLAFGAGPPQETTVTVAVAAPWVTSTSAFSFQVMTTPTHGPEDAAVEGLYLSVMNIVAGVGFDLMGVVQDGTNGTYDVLVMGALHVSPDQRRSIHGRCRDGR